MCQFPEFVEVLKTSQPYLLLVWQGTYDDAMKSHLSLLVVSALLITGCSGTDQNSNSNQQKKAEVWTSSSLLSQSIDQSVVKKWGYFGSGNSSTIDVRNFLDPSRDTSKDLVSTRPSECEPIGALFATDPKTGADYVLFQTESDSYLLASKTMIYTVFAYSDPKKATLQYEKIKEVANNCGSFTQMRSSKATISDNWESIEFGQDNVLRAVNSEYSRAYAIGLSGSAIFLLVFIADNLTNAKATRDEAINLVLSNLSTGK